MIIEKFEFVRLEELKEVEELNYIKIQTVTDFHINRKITIENERQAKMVQWKKFIEKQQQPQMAQPIVSSVPADSSGLEKAVKLFATTISDAFKDIKSAESADQQKHQVI